LQTFLPYADYHKSAHCLDRQRLGKQRVECLQILKALLLGTGWVNHPATLMWKNHEHALAEYALVVCGEWMNRSYQDTCTLKIVQLMIDNIDKDFVHVLEHGNIKYPAWLGDERLHKSHRTALLCKDYVHYCSFGWDEAEPIPLYYEYFWPTLSADYGGTGDGILRK
jgi:hypothetical protein